MKVKRFFKENNKPKTPKIVMGLQTFNKIATLCRENDEEIMLFGLVEKRKSEKNNDVYYITDFLIPPQEKNSRTFVTTADKEYHDWLLKELDQETRNKMKVHFHTHPKMSTTPSGQDITTISEKIQNIDDFYIRMIMNHSLSLYIDLFDIENGLEYNEINVFIISEKESNFYIDANVQGITYVPNYKKIEELKKELKEKTIKKTYNYRTVQNIQYPNIFGRYPIETNTDEEFSEYYNLITSTYSLYKNKKTKFKDLSKESKKRVLTCFERELKPYEYNILLEVLFEREFEWLGANNIR